MRIKQFQPQIVSHHQIGVPKLPPRCLTIARSPPARQGAVLWAATMPDQLSNLGTPFSVWGATSNSPPGSGLLLLPGRQALLISCASGSWDTNCLSLLSWDFKITSSRSRSRVELTRGTGSHHQGHRQAPAALHSRLRRSALLLYEQVHCGQSHSPLSPRARSITASRALWELPISTI